MNISPSPAAVPDYAGYVGGSGTAAITFEWTVAATDEDTNGIFLYGDTDAQDRGVIDLDGGTISNVWNDSRGRPHNPKSRD